METVDARNLPCPEPVVMTKKALEKSADGKLTVILNSPESCQNVQRFLKTRGCDINAAEKDGEYTLEVSGSKQAEAKATASRTVLVIAGDQLGSGDEALGQLLITSLINTLPEAGNQPSRMLFINSGVRLTTEGSRVLETLQQLEAGGVEIFSCGTCLNHYQLKDKLKVGKVTNMYDTVASLLDSEKVVRI